tara:strand:+ start:761 stop:961 length:201 start_codon:yes stop_codon:yes gene_type:complete
LRTLHIIGKEELQKRLKALWQVLELKIGLFKALSTLYFYSKVSQPSAAFFNPTLLKVIYAPHLMPF